MKLIAHISDPHFGREDACIASALQAELAALQPDLVVVSGDLTQRAREDQFRAARAWLAGLTAPYLVVPGNHDIPLYDVVRRFLQPRERYREHITSDLSPVHVDDDVAVCGVDTTKSFTIEGGRLSREMAEHVAAQLAPYTNHWRIVVAHHPLEYASGAETSIPLFEAAGIDLVLSGHLHVARAKEVASRNSRHTMLAVYAGTCMSTRLRGEPNGYNQLAFVGDHVTITERVWRGDGFVDGQRKRYRRTAGRERIVKEVGAPVYGYL